jgi:hypothetical protein
MRNSNSAGRAAWASIAASSTGGEPSGPGPTWDVKAAIAARSDRRRGVEPEQRARSHGTAGSSGVSQAHIQTGRPSRAR